MPGLGEIAFSDLVKHPKLIILYAAFIGAGWLAERMIPTECDRNAERWQAAFYHSERRADSLNAANFNLYTQHIADKAISVEDKAIAKQQGQTIKSIDSLLKPVGKRAKQIIRNHGH